MLLFSDSSVQHGRRLPAGGTKHNKGFYTQGYADDITILTMGKLASIVSVSPENSGRTM